MLPVRRGIRWGMWIRATGLIVVAGFALIGFALTTGFVAIRLGLTNTRGRVDVNDRYFREMEHRRSREATLPSWRAENATAGQVMRRLAILQEFHPENARLVLAAYGQSQDPVLAGRMLEALDLYLREDRDYQARLAMAQAAGLAAPRPDRAGNAFPWMGTEDWTVFRAAVAKDRPVVEAAARAAGVEPRLVVTMMVSEQMRLFHSERESFKRCFAPLKMLGNETKFSLGVCGIKSETGRVIEQNLKDPGSTCYLGPEMEHLLDYSPQDLATSSAEDCRYRRLTEPTHYQSYLYTALFIRQVEQQWKAAGYDLSRRPEILATLFNIGFGHSTPKADPQVGGTTITLAGRTYTFGSFAYEFYYSGDLAELFPFS
nr:hypothetical protein [uncultured Holophaga sp.]